MAGTCTPGDFGQSERRVGVWSVRASVRTDSLFARRSRWSLTGLGLSASGVAERLRAVIGSGLRARSCARFGLPMRVDGTDGSYARLVKRFSSGGRPAGLRGRDIEG